MSAQARLLNDAQRAAARASLEKRTAELISLKKQFEVQSANFAFHVK